MVGDQETAESPQQGTSACTLSSAAGGVGFHSLHEALPAAAGRSTTHHRPLRGGPVARLTGPAPTPVILMSLRPSTRGE